MPGQHWTVSNSVTAHYEFLDLGAARVAGRIGQVIGVRPLDASRYGYRLWVDRDTHLLLRADVMDSNGETVERSAFTRIDISATVTDDALSPTLRGEVLSWSVTELNRDLTPGQIWRHAALPSGFTFDGARSRADGVEQQVFTDGIAMVSIFVGPVHEEAGLMGASRMGALSAFGLRVAGRQITVVGDLPEDAVRAIAESLRLGD
jgi:sigma-E factor negative regulatory protein RseB